jgi:hypothetical protein
MIYIHISTIYITYIITYKKMINKVTNYFIVMINEYLTLKSIAGTR